MLGGGKDLRPHTSVPRVPVNFDNTDSARMRGDYAVPTLFDGNFDAVTYPHGSVRNAISTEIPGWSFYNGTTSTLVSPTSKLVDVNQINQADDPALYGELDKLGVDRTQHNYALELDPGDSITHNRFVVPDWGVLRFDLHVPYPALSTELQNSVLRVFLDDTELQSSAFQRLVNGNQGGEYPAVDLRQVDRNIGAKNGEGQSNRIGYAQQGFQTFQIDIPNKFRGKLATLRFALSGTKTVYLDNVFFKSQQLLFGNPALNGQQARKDIDTPTFYSGYKFYEDIATTHPSNFFDNYLIERPQYTVSYNDNLTTPNWVSYQLNKSWLGTYNNDLSFGRDPRLPFSNPTEESDITNSTDYQKGHMTTASHRSRTIQDYAATYLMSDIIPQPLDKPNRDRWTTLEKYLTALVQAKNQEFYIIAGRDGQAVDNYGLPLLLNNKVSVPENVWKVVLVLDKPGQGISDVTKDTLAFAVRLPNTAIDYTGTDSNYVGQKVSQDPDNDWTQKIINIDELEYITGYNFLSNIPTEIQEVIKGRSVGDIKAKLIAIVTSPASLMAATDDELPSFSVPKLGSLFNSTIWHSSLPDQISTTTDGGFPSNSISEVSISQNGVRKTTDISSTKPSTSGIDVIQVSSPQIGFSQITPMQVGALQISIPNNSAFQGSAFQGNTKQISSGQISFNQKGISQISSAQVDLSQNSPFEVNRTVAGNTLGLNQLNSSEVSLPISIPSQQLLSSNFPNHNLTSNFVSPLKFSATNIWEDLLKPQTEFDINIEITPLAKGQLAEAIITKKLSQNEGTNLRKVECEKLVCIG